MPKFHIATSGWNYPHWKERFYPPEMKKKDWFKYYTGHFSTVEVNYSFYNWPREEILKNWAGEAPRNFIYTLKAHRLITHLKKLKNVEESVQRFYRLTSVLGNKMGCHLFQLPPNYTYTKNNLDKLKAFLKLLDRGKDNAIEFRENGWWNEDVYALLRKHNVAFVTVFGMELPEDLIETGDIAYLRFHGHETNYSGQKLRSIADGLKKSKAKRVYVYFNNDAYGYAPINAKELKEYLS